MEDSVYKSQMNLGDEQGRDAFLYLVFPHQLIDIKEDQGVSAGENKSAAPWKLEA